MNAISLFGQVLRWHGSDEELRAVTVRACILCIYVNLVHNLRS